MPYDSWTCVSVEKGPGTISDEVRTELTFWACHMAASKFERTKISGDHCSGVMVTEFKHYMLGLKSGILFRAEIDGDGENYFVNFIISEDSLKRGSKRVKKMLEERECLISTPVGDEIPIPELYSFTDLRRSGVH